MKMILGLMMAMFLAGSAGAADIGYRFTLKDINLPGQLIPNAGMYDLNDKGIILAAAYFNDGIKAIITNGKIGARENTEVFSCAGYEQGKGLNPDSLSTFIEGFSLSNKRHVAGYCFASDDTKSFMSGFVKGSNTFALIDVPGAEATMAQGISRTDGRYVTGTFWELGRPACFLLNRQTHVLNKITFDPSGNSTCYAVSDAGKILGEFWGGITNEHGFFIYDNGNFTVPLPLFNDQFGGFVPFDFNEGESILGLLYDDAGVHLFFLDDGQLFTIAQPTDWSIYNLGGMNDSGDFVGRVQVKVGVDEQCLINTPQANCNLYQEHGFVAAPERGALAGLR